MERAFKQFMEMIATGVVKAYNRNDQQTMSSGISVEDRTSREVSLEPGLFLR